MEHPLPLAACEFLRAAHANHSSVHTTYLKTFCSLMFENYPNRWWESASLLSVWQDVASIALRGMVKNQAAPDVIESVRSLCLAIEQAQNCHRSADKSNGRRAQ